MASSPAGQVQAAAQAPGAGSALHLAALAGRRAQQLLGTDLQGPLTNPTPAVLWPEDLSSRTLATVCCGLRFQQLGVVPAGARGRAGFLGEQGISDPSRAGVGVSLKGLGLAFPGRTPVTGSELQQGQVTAGSLLVWKGYHMVLGSPSSAGIAGSVILVCTGRGASV